MAGEGCSPETEKFTIGQEGFAGIQVICKDLTIFAELILETFQLLALVQL